MYHKVKMINFRYKLAVDLAISIIFLKPKTREVQMTEFIPIKSFDSEIIYDSEESVQHKELEDSFLNQVLEKAYEEESETRIKRDNNKSKTKLILKRTTPISTPTFPQFNERKKRNNSKSGKWSGANRINYYKSILKFSIEHPYYTVSWRYWKPEKFYPKMIDDINKTELYYKKDVIQTKSFDERQRKEYFDKEPRLDMIDLAIVKLKEIQATDVDAQEILAAFDQKSQEKSQHMQMLEEVVAKINEKKYDMEDMYFKIMGYTRSLVEECPNSVFYS